MDYTLGSTWLHLGARRRLGCCSGRLYLLHQAKSTESLQVEQFCCGNNCLIRFKVFSRIADVRLLKKGAKQRLCPFREAGNWNSLTVDDRRQKPHLDIDGGFSKDRVCLPFEPGPGIC